MGGAVARVTMKGLQNLGLSMESVTRRAGQVEFLPTASGEKEVEMQQWDISGTPAMRCCVTFLEKF